MKTNRSKVDVLLGLQWGDEGKGKIVDVFTPQYSIVARFQGGPNAGHTLEFDGKKMVLNTIPSGVFHPQTLNIIGNGVVIDPIVLKRELENLLRQNVAIGECLVVSKKAHLILPTHPLLDAAHEQAKGDKKIGSTLRGIGPTYQDKISRNGMRVGNILQDNFEELLQEKMQAHCRQLELLNYTYDLTERLATWREAIEFIREHLRFVDSEQVINQAINEGKTILAEGAQGTLLDIDFGSYPFVTSSNTITAGACTGLGIAPQRVGEVFGIFKAYCTRVGSGPFPTELHDDTGELLRKKGNEFGATTGRPRRCGWLDLPALKYAIQLNGATQLIMTKSDVLSEFETIQVCTHYRYKGEQIDYLPFEVDNLEPVYKAMKGWSQDLTDIREYDKLPTELHDYITYLEEELQVPIKVVSVGPDRSQTMIR